MRKIDLFESFIIRVQKHGTQVNPREPAGLTRWGNALRIVTSYPSLLPS